MSYLKAIVKGRVQGVGFRYFVYDLARQYGLKGTVRNLYSGAVEVQADGDDELLSTFLDALRTGPRMAQIDDVETEWSKEEKGFRDFRITF